MRTQRDELGKFLLDKLSEMWEKNNGVEEDTGNLKEIKKGSVPSEWNSDCDREGILRQAKGVERFYVLYFFDG